MLSLPGVSHAYPRRDERVRLQGVEGLLLPGEDEGEGDAPLLRGAAARRRDQQHLLPDARARDAAALGRAGPRRLRVRPQGLAAHHAPAAAGAGGGRDRGSPLRDGAARSATRLGPVFFQTAAAPEEGRRRGCAPSSAASPRRIPSPSSSATSRGSTTRSTTRCGRATRPSSPWTRTRPGGEGDARRAPPPTGATCACGGATTTTTRSPRGASRILAAALARGVRLLQARGGHAARLAGHRAIRRVRPGASPA